MLVNNNYENQMNTVVYFVLQYGHWLFGHGKENARL